MNRPRPSLRTSEYRVLAIEEETILVQPLDGVSPERFIVPAPLEFIEGEIIRCRRVDYDKRSGNAYADVVSSRIDPTFFGVPAPKPGPVKKSGYRLPKPPGRGRKDPRYNAGLLALADGKVAEAATLLKALAVDDPFLFDAWVYLGGIELRAGRPGRALKYLETGYRAGLSCLPPGFHGKLATRLKSDGPRLRTTYFLLVTRNYAACLFRLGRVPPAIELYEWLLELDPDDHSEVRFALATALVRIGGYERALELFEEREPDELNWYTKSLAELRLGRQREALASLCEGIHYNPEVPRLLLGLKKLPRVRWAHIDPELVESAHEYVQAHAALWEGAPLVFLETLIAHSAVTSRLNRLAELVRELEGVPVGPRRSELCDEKFALFTRDDVPKIVAACSDCL